MVSFFQVFIPLCDALIALAYFAIPLQMLYYMRTMSGLAEFTGILILFMLFIALCGLTHLISVWMPFWNTLMFLALAKLFCAIASCITSIVLVFLIPCVLAYPTYTKQMEIEVQERKTREKRLKYEYDMVECLRRIGQSLNSSQTEQEILEKLGREIKEEFRGDFGFYVLKDDYYRLRGHVSVNGTSNGNAGNLKEMAGEFPIRMSVYSRFVLKIMQNSPTEIDKDDFVEFATSSPSNTQVSYNENDDTVINLLRDSPENPSMLACFMNFGGIETDCKRLLPDIANHLSISLSLASKLTLLTQQREELLEKNNLLRQAQKEIELAHQQKEFLAVMSHEMRTPLFAICALTKMQLENKYYQYPESLDAYEGLEMLTLVKKSGDMLVNIVNNILDFAKVEDDKYHLTKEEFVLRDAIETAAEVVLFQSEKESPEVNIFVSDRVPNRVIGDFTRFRQILVNLLGNACKFTDSDGNVILKIDFCDCPEGKVGLAIQVQDDGIGIPRDALAKLYDKFYQVDKSITRSYGGLSIVKLLVELMDGNIYAVSDVGKGTSFHVKVYLDACDDGNHTPTFKQRFDKLRVAYIDRNPKTREAFPYLVQASGAKVACFDSFDSYEKSGEVADAMIVDLKTQTVDQIYEIVRELGETVMLCGNQEMIKKWKKYRAEHPSNNKTIVAVKPLKLSVLNQFFSDVSHYLNHSNDSPVSKNSDITVKNGNGVVPLITAKEDDEALYLKRSSSGEALDEEDDKVPDKIRGVPSSGYNNLNRSTSSLYSSAHSTFAKPSDRLKIMVVEDNSINQLVLKKIFSKLKLDIVMASNGQEAVDLFLRNPTYDVIFMDVMMPVKDGIEATREIRTISSSFCTMSSSAIFDPLNDAAASKIKKNSQKPWIIALTANTFNTDRLKCMEAGMNDFVSKPAYLQNIEEALSKFKHEMEKF